MHFALALDQTVPAGRLFERVPSGAEQASIEQLVAELKANDGSLRISFLAQALVNSALAAIPDDYWGGRAADPRIDEAVRTLRQDAEADNASLARAAGMNVNAFIRKFRQATGHSPHNYRLRLRVEQCCAWLRENGMSIEAVAAAAGFCDRYHFSRVFKRIMNTTPAEFRRRSAGR
jgi:AraC-like DNA-binding protein